MMKAYIYIAYRFKIYLKDCCRIQIGETLKFYLKPTRMDAHRSNQKGYDHPKIQLDTCFYPVISHDPLIHWCFPPGFINSRCLVFHIASDQTLRQARGKKCAQ